MTGASITTTTAVTGDATVSTASARAIDTRDRSAPAGSARASIAACASVAAVAPVETGQCTLGPGGTVTTRPGGPTRTAVATGSPHADRGARTRTTAVAAYPARASVAAGSAIGAGKVAAKTRRTRAAGSTGAATAAISGSSNCSCTAGRGKKDQEPTGSGGASPSAAASGAAATAGPAVTAVLP